MATPGLYHGALVLSAIVSFAVALDTVGHRARPGGAYLSVLMGSAGLWALGELGVDSLADPQLVRASHQLVHVGIVGLVLCFLLFSLAFAGRTDLITPRTVGALLVEPAVVLAVVFTNPLHGLFWDRVTGEFSALFWVDTAYSYVILAVATLLLVRTAVRSRRLYVPQFAAIVIGVTVPWLTNALVLFGPLETDYTPVAFVFSGLCLVVATRKLGFMDVVPVARDSLFATLEDAAIVLDDQDRLLDANPAFESLVGADDSPVGDPLEAVLADFPDLTHRILDEDSAVVDVDLPSGQRSLQAESSPVSDEYDRRLGRLVVLHDETEQLRRRRDLERRNEQLDQFASILSHDIRNPLNVASARLELARETGDEEHLEAMARAHERMEEIVEDALALARQGHGDSHPEPVDLAVAAREAWMHVDAPDASINVDAPGNLLADPTGLSHLLENLLANAVEHAGPTVRVTVERTEQGFAVADDGPGVPPGERDDVFQPGFSRLDDGTGLGLAIVHAVVVAHDWEIEVGESEAGGARFAITGTEWVDDGE